MRQNYENPHRMVIDVNQSDQYAINAYVAKVFGWMFFGLLLTALTTLGIVYGTTINENFANFIFRMQQLVFVVFVIEFALVIAISARVTKMNPTTAKLLYILYAILNGFTFGLFAIIYAYQTGGGIHTLGMAFGLTAVCFGVMAIYGLITKSDLTRFGNLLRMGLFGLIFIMIVSFFMRSTMLDFLINIGGLFLFLGITAHRTQMIKAHYAHIALSSENTYEDEYGYTRQSALASNLAIYGALTLYLAFINMFMFIMRLMGGGSRR